MTRRRRGLTLVELLVALALSAILLVAIGYAFTTGIDIDRLHAERRLRARRTDLVDERLRQLIQGAKLRETADDTETTFFVGLLEGGDDSLGADRLTFTTTAPPVSLVTQASADDFETQNQLQGPEGGLAEVSLGLQPVGAAPEGTGLYERFQRPTDTDPEQGGTESLLSPDIAQIGFQFWDGTQWVTEWDTQNGGERRLPAAVLVRYLLTGDDTGQVRQLMVPVPGSDIDADNPLTQGATS